MQKRPVLLMGGPGTAKTVTIEQFLSAWATRPDNDLFTWKKSNFSSATSPGLFQNVVEDVIEKRMGTTYGVHSFTFSKSCSFLICLNGLGGTMAC